MIAGAETDAATVTWMVDTVKSLGMKPVVVKKDVPGFVEAAEQVEQRRLSGSGAAGHQEAAPGDDGFAEEVGSDPERFSKWTQPNSCKRSIAASF